MAELCAWKNMIEGAGGDVCMENVTEGCWLSCMHERIWQKVVG